MWKIVKKSVEKIVLNKEKFDLTMKWEFKIEFASDSFWPYKYKFERTDCYFNDGLEDRWTAIFPLKNKAFQNTEIFLETSDIVIAVWERWSLMWEEKSFIDVINIKTEKKYRLFTEEISLIYNTHDNIIINAKETETWEYKTIELNIETMEKLYEKDEELQAFFKIIYNVTEKKYYKIDFFPSDYEEKDEEKKYQNWYFDAIEIKLSGTPKSFDRKNFTLKTDKKIIDVWEESIK